MSWWKPDNDNTWTYPSSSGPKPHTTTLAEDGLLSCTCKGYYIKRANKPKSCRHTEDVVKRLGLNIVQRGDLIYSVGADEALAGGSAAKTEAMQTRTAESLETALAQAEADGYVNPMLASAMTKGQEQNFDPYLSGWLWEEKWDGQRVVLAVKNHQVKAWGRPRPGEGSLGNPRALPKHLEEHCRSLPDLTLDTEQVVVGDRSWAVSNLALKDKQVLMVFDVMRVGPDSTLDLPVEVRKAIVEEKLKQLGSPFLLPSMTFTPGRKGVEEIWARGGEGAMLKRAGSIYRPGYRGPDWLKVKLWDYTTVLLTGFDKAKSGPHSVMLFRLDSGVDSRCKTLGNKWLAEFDKNADKYIGKRFVMKHQGLTPDGKPRHPQFDHFAGDGE